MLCAGTCSRAFRGRLRCLNWALIKTVWAEVESGEDKAAIVQAHLLYTLNPPQMDTIRGGREEWFVAPAVIETVGSKSRCRQGRRMLVSA